jgi:hypothetical protein
MKAGNRRLGISRKFLALSCSASVAAFLAVGCGGGGVTSTPPPPPPRQDFSLSVSPSTISMIVGTISQPVLISVVGQKGFSGAVNIAITGLPPGGISSPASPLVLFVGVKQALIFIPPTTPTGSLSIEFNASSGSLSHSATLNLTVTPVSGTAVLQDASGPAPDGTIEIQGLSAGVFTPTYWQHDTLYWVPDVRAPMFAAQTTGPYQNIYAPWPLEQANGWRLFYGGWDGQDVPFDQIFSVTTSDFLSFQNRNLVIAHGAFENVNNVNVQQLPDGSMHMICTAQPIYPSNWPAYFSSPDGVTWNGSLEPYEAQLADIIDIQGYAEYQSGIFNGANVLFRDNNSWVFYFLGPDNNNNWQVFRAVGDSPHTFQLTGIALPMGDEPNDVKKFVVGSQSWYLMGLMSNAPQLWYSLSNDGLTFLPEQTLFPHQSLQDLSMDSLGFVTSGSRLLGVLYGANTGSRDNQQADNKIFARWLQKRVVFIDSTGNMSLSHKWSLWVAASAATFRDLKNKGFSP